MRKVLLFASILAIPLYGFWIAPQWEAYQAKEERLQALKEKKQQLIEKLSSLKQVEETLAKKKLDTETLIKKIPKEVEQETILVAIKHIVEKNGFTFSSLEFSQEKNPELGVYQVRAHFYVEGRKDFFPRLLKDFEQAPRFFLQKDIQYTLSEVNGVEILSAPITLYAFFQEPPAEE